MNADEEDQGDEELVLSASDRRYGSGFAPGKESFPVPSLERYRALAMLPLLVLIMSVTSLPFFVLSIVFWDDDCLSENAWWYRPTTVCTVSNGLLMLSVPFLACSLGKVTREDSSSVLLVLMAFAHWSMKGLEIGSLIAAPIVSHWCNASLIVIADVVIGSFVPTFAVYGLFKYAADDQPGDRIDVKEILTDMASGVLAGVVLSTIPFVFFALQIAGGVVGIIALANDECGGSIWTDPSLPLVITSVLSLFVMICIFTLAVADCADDTFEECEAGLRCSICVCPLLLCSIAGAAWIIVALFQGECGSGDRVWWFGLLEAVYCCIVPFAWGGGSVMVRYDPISSCVYCIRFRRLEYVALLTP